jgi:hypothetical protein
MGIDTRAFGSSVERPSDTAAERGELRTIQEKVLVSGGGQVVKILHTNTSGTDQFLLFANVSQEPRSGSPVSDNLSYVVRILSDSGVTTFRVSESGRSLIETLPSLRIGPGGRIIRLIENQTSTGRLFRASVTFRQG